MISVSIDNSTASRKNWISDGGVLTDGIQSIENEIKLKSIYEDVERFKRAQNLLHHKLEFFTVNAESNLEREKNENVISFKAPDVTRSFSATESKNSFPNAQRWVGHVNEITAKTFFAELKDLNDPTTYEVGEFDIKEVSLDDRELLSIGAIFYWSIGLANYNGQVEKKSLIRFQRVTNYTSQHYDSVADKAQELFDNLNWG